MFRDLAIKLEKAKGSSDVIMFRQAICECLYVASLKLVSLNEAIFTDECWNQFNEYADRQGVAETLQAHVAQYFGMLVGKM